MKKFNPENELSKIQNHQSKKVYILPALLMFFSIITIAGIAYSSSNNQSDKKYTIKLEIINGKEDSYLKQVSAGPYEDIIDTDATFGSINCIKGKLEYDSDTKRIYSDNITENTTCILSFMDDGSEDINFAKLAKIYDNDGASYYYKGDAIDNYLKYNNQLYRIIRINGDGSIRIMLEESIGNYSYGNTNKYEISNIPAILDKWYNDNFKNENRVITKEFDLENYMTISPQNLYILTNYINAKVGLLSIKEILLINGNVNTSYIKERTLTTNGYDLNKVWVSSDVINKNESAEIHPVINIKYSKLKGRGTIKMPYEIEE